MMQLSDFAHRKLASSTRKVKEHFVYICDHPSCPIQMVSLPICHGGMAQHVSYYGANVSLYADVSNFFTFGTSELHEATSSSKYLHSNERNYPEEIS